MLNGYNLIDKSVQCFLTVKENLFGSSKQMRFCQMKVDLVELHSSGGREWNLKLNFGYYLFIKSIDQPTG